MGNIFKNIIYREKLRLAKMAGGDYLFNIVRPHYEQMDASGVIVSSNVLAFIEPAGDAPSTDRVPGLTYFTIASNSDLFQIGDYFLTSSPDIPDITVSDKSDEQEWLGIRTERFGVISDGPVTLYTTVKFSYISNGSAGNSFFFDQSLEKLYKKVAVWRRSGLLPGQTFTDTFTGEIFNIGLIEEYNRVQIIYLTGQNRV